MGQRHKVFVSYHHRLDQEFKDRFLRLFSGRHDILVDQSVWDGDVPENWSDERIRQHIRDNYIRDSTVTVVLVGSETWGRKHVDWEIYSSLKDTEKNPVGGLMGIVLPTHPGGPHRYDKSHVPQRLLDNVSTGYAAMHPWSTDPDTVQDWLHQAFKRRDTHYYNRDLRTPLRRRNSTP